MKTFLLGLVLALAMAGALFGPSTASTICVAPRTFSLSAWNSKAYRIFYVRASSGIDRANSGGATYGRSHSTAWRTIDYAMDHATAGTDSDAVILVFAQGVSDSLTGSATFDMYNGFLPTAITGSGRMFIYSAPWWYCGADPTSENRVQVRGMTRVGTGVFNPGSAWTAAGFNFYQGATIGTQFQSIGGVTCDSAQTDTIRESYVVGAVDFARARRSAFVNCTGPVEFMGLPGGANNVSNSCSYINCTFLGLKCNNWFGLYCRGIGPGDESWNNKISRCRLRITNPGPSGGAAPWKTVYNEAMVVEYSTIEINMNASSGDNTNEPFLSYMRDNSEDVVFNADTVLFNSPNIHFTWMFTASGNDNTPQRRMVIDSCYFQAGKGVSMIFLDALQATTITYSTFIAYDTPALEISGAACMYGTSRLDHNSFITAGDCAAFDFAGVVGDPDNPPCDSTVITNCLFANLQPMTQRPSTNDPACGWRVRWAPAHVRSYLKSDWNFYYVNPFMFLHNDRDLMYADSTLQTTVSRAGPSQAFTAFYPLIEGRSLYGWANFDAGGADTVVNQVPPCRLCAPKDSLFGTNLGPASPANGKGKSGTDPGAVQHAAQTYSVLSIAGATWDFSRDAGHGAEPETLLATITNAGDGTLTLSNLRTYGTLWIVPSLSGTTATYGQLLTLKGIVATPGTAANIDTVYFDTNDIAHKTVAIPVRLNASGSGGSGHLEP